MPISDELSYEILRLRANLARLKFELHLLNLQLKAGFDPNEPRVPRGNSGGGQWTRIGAAPGAGASGGGGRTAASGGGGAGGGKDVAERVFTDRSGKESWRTYVERYRPDGTVESRTILNRDGSRIATEFGPADASGTDQRNTVTLADGSRLTFENSGTTQRIYDPDGRLISDAVWTPDGPEPRPTVQPVVFVTSPLADQLFDAGRILYNWLTTTSSPELPACFAFKARDFQLDGPGTQLLFSGLLSRADVQTACSRLNDVQTWTNEAAEMAGLPSSYSNSAVYGTKVHTLLRRKIDSLGDPDLRAEVSLMKTFEESPRLLGSIRIDVVEDHGVGPVCVYDIKTGKRGLSLPRATEFVRRLSSVLQGRPMIVTEIRPSE